MCCRVWRWTTSGWRWKRETSLSCLAWLRGLPTWPSAGIKMELLLTRIRLWGKYYITLCVCVSNVQNSKLYWQLLAPHTATSCRYIQWANDIQLFAITRAKQCFLLLLSLVLVTTVPSSPLTLQRLRPCYSSQFSVLGASCTLFLCFLLCLVQPCAVHTQFLSPPKGVEKTT